MDVTREAQRLATIATYFVWVGWIFVIYALVAGVLWWIDLASKEAFNFLESFALSASAIAGPIFIALLVAGVGHTMRLFALYVASKSRG